MVQAIQIDRFGGPEVLEYRDVKVPEPSAGQARVKHTAVGVNFIDVYHRTGLYPLPLPSGLGSEAAGVVVATGAGVTHVKRGDRVAYNAAGSLGSYSDERLVDARWLVKLPSAIDDRAGAAMMLKGLTAWYLLNRSYQVQRGDSILLYAAAGGVGLIAAQWARHLGAHVIGIVSTEDKRALALEHGCEHVLLAGDDIRARVRALTDGRGVPVVYDSVGRDTLYQSLDCLRTHGLLVSFGNSSGMVEPFPLHELTKRGSLYVTRPTLGDFIRERADLEAGSSQLFGLVERGVIRIEVNQTYALADAASAHRDLEARRTTGSTVLLP
jgi:NADPH2:quinone reductase